MKLTPILLGMLLTGFALPAAEETPQGTNNGAKAVLQPVKHADELGTDYRIRVDFGTYIPRVELKRDMFQVRDKGNDAVIPITGYGRAGGETNDNGVIKFQGMNLNGKYDPTRAYRVIISFPNTPAMILDTAPIEGKYTNKEPPLLNFNYRNFWLDLNPFTADEDNAFGLKYDVRYQVIHRYVNRSGVLNIDLQTHGEFSLTSLKNSTNAIQNSLKGGLTASYLHDVEADLVLGNETRTYVYPLGIRVAPAEFEANKSLSRVDYTAKLLLGGAIPYADYPALLWNKAFNVDVPFFAPTLFTGFAALSEVKDDGSDTLSRLGHTRWDTEFIYALPLHRRLDFKFVWNWYVGIERGFSKDNYEVGAVLYLDDARTQGFTLSRQAGALPPDFVHSESWRLGYTAKF